MNTTTATKTTAHSNCTHPKTKAARALCRKTRSTVQTVTTSYGTFEVRTAHVSEITDKDMIHSTARDRGETVHLFVAPTSDAFRAYDLLGDGTTVDRDFYYLSYNGKTNERVPADTYFTVAVNPLDVKRARNAR